MPAEPYIVFPGDRVHITSLERERDNGWDVLGTVHEPTGDGFWWVMLDSTPNTKPFDLGVWYRAACSELRPVYN